MPRRRDRFSRPCRTSPRSAASAEPSSYADDLYISTADGGFWKSVDGGTHWSPLFDAVNGSVIFGGAIATISKPSPTLVYFGTGEGNNSADSFYGSGVYKNGVLLTSANGANPLRGKAITKIIIDPANPLRIYTAHGQV